MEPNARTNANAYVLSESTLDRCRERAAQYDAENRFFFEDFDELKDAGYTKLNVPKEFGGFGRTLLEVCHEQRRLAMYAPATALAINMHLYWCGVAGAQWRQLAGVDTNVGGRR